VFNQLKAVLDITKEIPDAVGYVTYGPMSYPVPKEIGKISDGVESLTILWLQVENYSSRAQKNLRVLYSGDWQYHPDFEFDRRTVAVKHEIKDGDKEIVIAEIPPNEKVAITFYNPSPKFHIEQVLIGDSVITPTMQRLAKRRRYPLSALTKLSFVTGSLVILVGVGSTSYALYQQLNSNSELNRLSAALKDVESCSMKLEKTPSFEQLLARREMGIPYFSSLILKINKVDSVAELAMKEEILYCQKNEKN
jgi:hypothetical protein